MPKDLSENEDTDDQRAREVLTKLQEPLRGLLKLCEDLLTLQQRSHEDAKLPDLPSSLHGEEKE